MGIFKQLANARLKYEIGANYELGNSLSSNMVSSVFGKGGSAINVLEEYNGFAWKCINIKAETLSDNEVFVERKVGDKWQRDNKHEFNAVLEGDRSTNDLSELLEGHSKSLDLYGESFWYYSKGENSNKPMNVYLLDPSAMTVMVSNHKITGYVYQKDADRVVLDLDEVDFYKISDPRSKNGFRGYGAMQAAGWFIRSDRYVNTYVNNFLENNAIPAGVVVAKESVDNKDWQLFKDQWSSNHSGINNAGKTGFVRGSDLSFVKTGLSLGEIDLEKIKGASREDIMIMFGISKPMMAIFDDINRASATVARQLFAMTITSPRLNKIKRKLSRNVNDWYGDSYKIGATNPIPEDDETKLEQYNKGVGRWFTINEAREAYGKEPIPGGDEIQPEVAPSGQETAKVYIKPKSKPKITIKTKVQKSRDFSVETKESFRSEAEDIQKKHETKFINTLGKLIKEQKKMVLDQLKPKKLADANFDIDKEVEKQSTELEPILVSVAKAQGNLALDLVGNTGDSFVINAVVAKYLKESLDGSLKDFNTQTRDKISETLTEGINNGESVILLSKRIGGVYKDIEDNGFRAERLARTEVIKTSNEMSELAYKQSEVVAKKEWFANPDACEFCKALDGSTIALDANYVGKGELIIGVDGGTRYADYEAIKHPPTHPSCRCTILGVIE